MWPRSRDESQGWGRVRDVTERDGGTSHEWGNDVSCLVRRRLNAPFSDEQICDKDGRYMDKASSKQLHWTVEIVV